MSSAVPERRQLATDTEYLQPVSSTDVNEVQFRNMLVKLVPAAVFNAGIDVNEVQFRNMLEKLVPAAVFNAGIDVNE